MPHNDGADASRRAIGAADYHPLSARRYAPAIKRLKLTVGPARKRAALPQLICSAVSIIRIEEMAKHAD